MTDKTTAALKLAEEAIAEHVCHHGYKGSSIDALAAISDALEEQDHFAASGKRMAEQEKQEPKDIMLPVDVTIGCGTIKAGCSLQTLLTRIKVINQTWVPKIQSALQHKRGCNFERIDQDKSECTCGVTEVRNALAEQDKQEPGVLYCGFCNSLPCACPSIPMPTANATSAHEPLKEASCCETYGCTKHCPKYYAAPVSAPKQEPVAYLVTGPYEKHAFADIGSAEAYCRGLNKGFGDAAYSVSPLYAAPVSAKREWIDLTCQEVTALIMEGAAGGGWQGFAERVQAAFKEKNNG